MWDPCVASTVGEVITPDMALATEQNQKQAKGGKVTVDVRTLTYEAAMRKVYIETKEAGNAPTTSMFGSGDDPSHLVNTTICTGHTIMREQRRAIETLKAEANTSKARYRGVLAMFIGNQTQPRRQCKSWSKKPMRC